MTNKAQGISSTSARGTWKDRCTTTIVNVCRIAIAITFVLSGFVKAVDPLGTQYKIADYAEAMGLQAYAPDLLTLLASIGISAIEFLLGICLLFAIHRRVASKLIVMLMTVMTALTLWLALANPISDCGCFGDALKLTNWETLWKNVALLIAAIIVSRHPLRMFRFVSLTNQWIVMNFSTLFILTIAGYSLYKLPPFDFRPYHVGANIKEGMQIPADAEQPQFETTFVMEKNGEVREFTIDNYPDSTWIFIDSKTVQISEGYVPPITDFSITTADTGEDITDSVLNYKGYTFLLIAPHLENADDSNLDLINQIHDYAVEYGYRFYCLTASGKEGIDYWTNITGAEYQYYHTDEITLKTIVRSNPGLVLLKDATVISKRSHNDLPTEYDLTDRLENLPLGQINEKPVQQKILIILLWFVLPLFILTVADRLWAWTKWIKDKEESNKLYKLLKRKDMRKKIVAGN